MTLEYFIPPIVYITIAFITGIILQSTDFVMYIPILVLISIALFCSSLTDTKKHFLLLILLVCVTGSLSIYQQKYHFVQRSQELPKKFCSIRAIVTDVLCAPEKNFPYRYSLTVTHIKQYTTAWSPFACQLHLFLRAPPPTLCPGITIETKPVAISPMSKQDLQSYAMKLDVIGSIFCSTIDYTVISDESQTWRYAKHRVIGYFKQHLSPGCFSMLSAIFLGNKSYNNKKQRTLFTQWGIAHHLARSGLHLMIIIVLWSTFAAMMPMNFYVKQLILLALTLIYLHMSWASIPFYRALWVFLLHRLCLLFRIHCHMLHCLALVCLMCLAYNPIQLFFLDFQLSFALTFALIIINHLEIIQQRNKHQILAQQ